MAVQDTPKVAKKKVEKKAGSITITLHEQEFTQDVKEATAKGVAFAIQEMNLPFPKGKAVVKIDLGDKSMEKTIFRQDVLKLKGALSSVEINAGLLMRNLA